MYRILHIPSAKYIGYKVPFCEARRPREFHDKNIAKLFLERKSHYPANGLKYVFMIGNEFLVGRYVDISEQNKHKYIDINLNHFEIVEVDDV